MTNMNTIQVTSIRTQPAAVGAFQPVSLRLLVIVKTALKTGQYCYIGFNVDNVPSKNLYRPIPWTAIDCFWSSYQVQLEVGKIYEFNAIFRHPDAASLPHINDDVLVSPTPKLLNQPMQMDIFQTLLPFAIESIPGVFHPGQILEDKYIVEGVNCSSTGLYKCRKENLVFYLGPNEQQRLQIKPTNPNVTNGRVYDFPITASSECINWSDVGDDVVVALGLARPFAGSCVQFSPKRCYILVIGIYTGSIIPLIPVRTAQRITSI